MYSDRTVKAFIRRKQREYLHQAERYRLLRENRISWRYQLADSLLHLASRLSPDHQSLLHNLRQSRGTLVSDIGKVETVKPC